MTQITDKVNAIEVPDDASEFRIMKFSKPETFSYDYSITRNGNCTSGLIAMVDLPPGTWRFLFTTNTATEEDARKVVGNPQYDSFGCYEVYSPYGVTDDPYETANDALDGLLRSKNLDDKNNYALIEKESNDVHN